MERKRNPGSTARFSSSAPDCAAEGGRSIRATGAAPLHLGDRPYFFALLK
jgi:hypothetical protein